MAVASQRLRGGMLPRAARQLQREDGEEGEHHAGEDARPPLLAAVVAERDGEGERQPHREHHLDRRLGKGAACVARVRPQRVPDPHQAERSEPLRLQPDQLIAPQTQIS